MVSLHAVTLSLCKLLVGWMFDRIRLRRTITLCCLAAVASAALLLSGFTDKVRPLVLGVNVGGLGTPIASLASLISLKLYGKAEGARTGRYLAVFTLINVLFLAVLTAAVMLLGA